jgi:hypothetical protein
MAKIKTAKDIKNEILFQQPIHPSHTSILENQVKDLANSIVLAPGANTPVGGATSAIKVASTITRYKIIKTLIEGGQSLMPWEEKRDYEGQKTKAENEQNDIFRRIESSPNTSKETPPIKQQKSKIYIVDIDSPDLDSIELQWIPKTLNVNPENKLVAIASIGRNNPFYHYAGSEDTIEFSIDWFFMNDESRTQALKSARWLESISKSSGYEELHRIKLIWGGSGIFENCYFLVEHAGYEMSNWADWGFNNIRGGSVKDILANPKYFGLLPQQITQEVRLKKVTEFNLTYADMRGSSNGPLGVNMASKGFIIPPNNFTYER